MKLQVEYVPISTIKPYKRNAKLHPQEQIEQIKNSMQEFGNIDPIGVWHDEIVEGHGRYEALKQMGVKEIPIIRLDDLTDEQRKAYALAHNKLTMNSDFDLALLDTELAEIETIDMTLLGFDDKEEETPQEVVEDDFDEEPPAEPIAKYGDIYQLGRHRLMCGDSTKTNDVECLMGGYKADMVFTDPPYGMNLDTDYSKMNGSRNNIEFKQRKNVVGGKSYEQGAVDEFNPTMIESIFSLFNYTKEVFLFGADYFAEMLPNKNDGSWIVWDKRDNNQQFDKMYGSSFELCWSKNRHKREIARVRWCGVFGTEKEFDHKRHHPTQKPIALARWFLDRYSQDGDNVVDLFGGSGCTLIACEQSNRKCFMMELDPKYVDVIINRWETFTGQKAVKLNAD